MSRKLLIVGLVVVGIVGCSSAEKLSIPRTSIPFQAKGWLELSGSGGRVSIPFKVLVGSGWLWAALKSTEGAIRYVIEWNQAGEQLWLWDVQYRCRVLTGAVRVFRKKLSPTMVSNMFGLQSLDQTSATRFRKTGVRVSWSEYRKPVFRRWVYSSSGGKVVFNINAFKRISMSDIRSAKKRLGLMRKRFAPVGRDVLSLRDFASSGLCSDQ